MSMKVHDFTITKNTQTVYSTFYLLNIILKVFALDSNGQRDAILPKSLAIFRSTVATAVLGSINFYTLYYKVVYIYDQISPSIKFTDVVQMIYDFWQYIADLFFVYQYGRDTSVEYLKNYGSIDKILGVAYYSTVKAKLVKLIAIFMSIWLLSSSCDFAAWVMGFGWIITALYSIAYFYLLIKILTTLDLSAHAMNIECRLRSICDVLQDCYCRLDHCPEVKVDYLNSKNWFYSDACSRVLKLQMQNDYYQIPYNVSRDVKSLTRCYLMLIEQVTFINKMFGFRVLLNILSFLIDIIRFTNIAVRVIIGSQQTVYYSGYFPAVSSTMRLLTCISVLVCLVFHCEQVYRQNDTILNVIDHLLIYKKPTELLREDVAELQGLIQSRPIRFNMANFFTLNYSLLLSVASVVVTYTIIILQSMN